jgi:diguanylate cyclase (GGDEF)-like protein/PAS domain S-box-containing protein
VPKIKRGATRDLPKTHTGVSRKNLTNFYMWAVVAAGAAVVVFSIGRLRPAQLGLPFVLLLLVTIALASRIVVQFFRFDSYISISEIFIFLALLLFDGEAAIVVAAMEGLFSSLRITKRPLTMAFNSASMAVSTFATAWTLRLLFGSITDLSRGTFSSRLITATCTMAFVQYIVNSGLVAVAGALKANKPVWATYKQHYVWTSLTYFAGASAAGLTVRLVGVVGLSAFIATMPIVAVLYFTYITYVKNVESSTSQAEQAKRHLAEMQESEERFRSAFDHAPIGMALVAPDGRWLQVNQCLCDIAGYSENEFKGMTFQSITHPDDLGDFLARLKQVVEGQLPTHQMEKRYLHKLGHEVWVLLGVSLIRDSESKCLHLIFQIQDITHRKRAEQQLVHEALHDALTGLPNRAWFMEQLQSSLDLVHSQKDRLFAVLFLDLDRFKLINDSIGHMVGDQLLIGIAKRLTHCIRPGDKVARLGGDEFTILLDDIRNTAEAIEVADRIQKHISKPFNVSGYETFTTVSIGIALSNPDYKLPEDFLRDADTAMYQAKSLGKARHVIFDKGMHARAVNLLQLETDLRRAIDRDEFFIEYQPIVELESGRLVGFEALVRWQHPDRGSVLPDRFIAVAEETGFIVPIGQWVLLQACLQMQRWNMRHSPKNPLSISVNLSGRQFTHSNLLEQITQILEATGLDPCLLKLEITESVVMDSVESAAGTLEELRALGVELSIDDFGTGYSSLSYLHKLPIDTLKIDRSFVSRMGENNENKEIVRTIIMLAKTLGMGVIAEGVETKEQADLLRELGCQCVQGYLVSRPLDAESTDRLILSALPAWEENVLHMQEIYDQEVFETLASAYPM